MAFFARFNDGGDGAVEGLSNVLVEKWSLLQDQGISIVAIKDTPNMGFDPGVCLASSQECTTPRSQALKLDPLVVAAGKLPGVTLLDLTDEICGPEVCELVVGNLIAWRDSHHLTATYSKALAPYIAQELGMQVSAEAPLAPVAPKVETFIAVELHCEPSGPNPRIDRTYKATFADGVLAVRNGIAGESGYETWNGNVLPDGNLSITGEYIEGFGGLKILAFSAIPTSSGGFEGQGVRGPRGCTIEVQPMSGNLV